MRMLHKEQQELQANLGQFQRMTRERLDDLARFKALTHEYQQQLDLSVSIRRNFGSQFEPRSREVKAA